MSQRCSFPGCGGPMIYNKMNGMWECGKCGREVSDNVISIGEVSERSLSMEVRKLTKRVEILEKILEKAIKKLKKETGATPIKEK